MAGVPDDVDAVRAALVGLLGEFGEEGSLGDTVARRLNEALVAAVPELGADPVIRADFEAATNALATALAGTRVEEPLVAVPVPTSVLNLVRTMARRRLDVTVVLRGFRVGSRLAWGEVIKALDEHVPDLELRYALLTVAWDRIAAAIEEVAEVAVVAYTEERDAWLSGAHARRAEAVAALLSGEAGDLDAITATLGYRVRRHHVACTFWLDETVPGRDPLHVLEDAAATLVGLLGAGDVLTWPEGARSLSAWYVVEAGVDLGRLRGTRLPPGVRLAHGLTEPGAAGFARSHRQALAARAVAQRAAVAQGVTSYDQVQLVSAFLDQPDRAQDLVRRELGGLAARDATAERLRETALAYLRAGGNARDAAALLGTHKNTVLYRLRSIEELLGRPVLERRLMLEVALTLVEQLGDAVLPV